MALAQLPDAGGALEIAIQCADAHMNVNRLQNEAEQASGASWLDLSFDGGGFLADHFPHVPLLEIGDTDAAGCTDYLSIPLAFHRDGPAEDADTFPDEFGTFDDGGDSAQFREAFRRYAREAEQVLGEPALGRSPEPADGPGAYLAWTRGDAVILLAESEEFTSHGDLDQIALWVRAGVDLHTCPDSADVLLWLLAA